MLTPLSLILAQRLPVYYNDNILLTTIVAIAMPYLDVIMDMLGSEEERMAILDYYQKSDEPQAVKTAIEEVCNSTDEVHFQQR